MPLTNTQYNTIMRRYEARQLENQHILEQRIRQVHAQCPRLKEVEDTISSLSVSKAKLMLNGDERALDSLKTEIHKLIEEKHQLLNQLGYPSDYFEPPYQCPSCKDTGYIGTKKCHCFQQATLDMVYRQSNMYKIIQQENFDTFSFDYYSRDDIDEATHNSSYQNAVHAVETCKSFVRDFDSKFENLLIYGNTGIGKTFLTNCIAKELLDTEHSVIYFTTYELLQNFQQMAFGGAELQENNPDLFECDLLIIDDLGTELTNSFTNSQLFTCLNQRILHRKSTIISTNLTLTQLRDVYSERIFSRITSHYTILKMFGMDIRVQKKLKGN